MNMETLAFLSQPILYATRWFRSFKYSTKPLDILAYQYDIVCNGIELSSGAVRNHDPEIMIKAFEIAGYKKDEIEKRFYCII